MKTLQVVLAPRESGGHEAALFGWLADAAATGWLRPVVHLPAGSLERGAMAAGLPPECLVVWGSGQDGRLAALAAVCRQTGGSKAPDPLLLAPGVLHAQAWLLAAALASGRSTWLYVPMTYSAHAMHYPWPKVRDTLLRPWLHRVHAWITIDAFQAMQLRLHWRVRAPVHVLPNRPRLPSGPPPMPRDRSPDEILAVGFVGRFDAGQKGLDWLCHVLRRQDPALRDFRWHLQGHGPAEAMLRSLAGQLPPGQVQVHAFGSIDAALGRCDVLMLCSRYEGLPLVALEATARGWPVVATHESRLEGLLPQGSLFRFGDLAGLLQALNRLRDAEVRRAAVRHAQDRLAEHFSPAQYRAALRDVLDELPTATGAVGGTEVA